MTGPGQSFTWVRWTWDVDRALEAVADQPARPFQVLGLALFLSMRIVTVDDAHVDRVDLTQPILLAPIPGQDYGLLPIDGWHRIARALRDGIPTLPARVLSVEQSAATCRDVRRAS